MSSASQVSDKASNEDEERVHVLNNRRDSASPVDSPVQESTHRKEPAAWPTKNPWKSGTNSSTSSQDGLTAGPQAGNNRIPEAHQATAVQGKQQKGRSSTEWIRLKCNRENAPDWAEPVARSSVVLLIIFFGAFFVSAIGYTGSILAVDVTVGNMINITSSLATEEVRNTAAEYAIRAQMAGRVYNRLLNSTGQVSALSKQNNNTFDVMEQRQWSYFRKFLGKQVAEDENILWMDVWDMSTTRIFGASQSSTENDVVRIYDEIPECMANCNETDLAMCCLNPSSHEVCQRYYDWSTSFPSQGSKSGDYVRYSSKKEAIRASRLGHTTCADESIDSCQPLEKICGKSLWELTSYMKENTVSYNGTMVSSLEFMAPRWKILEKSEMQHIPGNLQKDGSDDVVLFTLPLFVGRGESSSLILVTMGLKTSIFIERVMTVIAISGVAGNSDDDISDVGYSLSDGGCFGVVDLSTDSPVSRMSNSQAKDSGWKYETMYPKVNDRPALTYGPIGICSSRKLGHYAEASKSLLEDHYKYSMSSFTNSDVYGPVFPGSVSWWPITSDTDPSGATTSSFYRSPWASDDSAGDVVVGFHAGSNRGWPVNTERTDTKKNLFRAAEAGIGPKVEDQPNGRDYFLPSWAVFVATPRARIVRYLRSQMAIAITLTLAAMAVSALLLLHARIRTYRVGYKSHYRAIAWLQNLIETSNETKSAKQVESGDGGDKSKGINLGGLTSQTISIMILGFSLTMFLTFTASSKWGNLTDGISERVTKCASILGSRVVQHEASLRQIALNGAADMRAVHFLAPVEEEEGKLRDTNEFLSDVRSARSEYERSVMSDIEQDNLFFNTSLPNIPSQLLDYHLSKATAAIGYADALLSLSQLGFAVDSIGTTLWGDQEDGYIAAQPVTLRVKDVIAIQEGEMDFHSAWKGKHFSSISIVILDELDENVVDEYVMYPAVRQSELHYLDRNGNMKELSRNFMVHSQGSSLDLAMSLLSLDIAEQVLGVGDQQITERPPLQAQRTIVNRWRDDVQKRLKLVGKTVSGLNVLAIPWSKTLQTFRNNTFTSAAGETICNSVDFGVSEVPDHVISSMFSATWTYVYTLWSPSSGQCASQDLSQQQDGIVTGFGESRSFVSQNRAQSLSYYVANQLPPSSSQLSEALASYIQMTLFTSQDSIRLLSQEYVHIPVTVRQELPGKFSFLTKSHAEMTLGSLNWALSAASPRFSTVSQFDNTSPFEFDIDQFDQPHRLVLSEGPLRLMKSVDSLQVSLGRLVVFSNAYDRLLTSSLDEVMSTSPRIKSSLGKLEVVLGSRATTSFPERHVSLSPLFSGAGLNSQNDDSFDAVLRPAAVLLGSSHGGVLSIDFENGGMERKFVAESGDSYITTASLRISGASDFFQYGRDASTLSALAVTMGALQSKDVRKVNFIGVGELATFVTSTHVVGGATGGAVFFRKCVRSSNSESADLDVPLDNFLGSVLATTSRLGSDLDVISSGLIHRRTIKRESESWQWAVFLISVGPIVCCALLAGLVTTMLKYHFLATQRTLSNVGNQKQKAEKSKESRQTDKNRRITKIKTFARLASMAKQGTTKESSASDLVRMPSVPRISLNDGGKTSPGKATQDFVILNESDMMIPADPSIESAMHAIHGSVATVYGWGARWDCWQQYRIKEALHRLRNPPQGAAAIFWHRLRKCCTRSVHSNHVSNILVGLQRPGLLTEDTTTNENINPMNSGRTAPKARLSLIPTAIPPKEVTPEMFRWEASVFRRAREFIHMYTSDRHALEVVHLEKEGRWNSETAHAWITSSWYKTILYLTIAGYLCLSFFEASGTVVGGGALDDQEVIMRESASPQLFPADSSMVADDDIELTVGAALEGRESLPVESSVDGRNGWSLQRDGAFGSGVWSSSSPVERVRLLRSQLLLAELFILLALVVDAILTVLLKGIRKEYYSLYDVTAATTRREASRQSSAQKSEGKYNLTKPLRSSNKKSPSYRLLVIVRCVMLFALVLDFLVRLGVDYRTGRSATLLPITVVIRPFFAVVRVPSIRRSLQALASTILLARRTFTLFITFTIVIAAISMALFSDYTDLGEGPVEMSGGDILDSIPLSAADDAAGISSSEEVSQFEDQVGAVSVSGAIPGLNLYDLKEFNLPALGRGFTNFQASWFTIFILAATGENYDDIAYPDNDPTDDGGFIGVIFRPYFIIIALAGMFILGSLLLVSFQTRYNDCYEVRARSLITRKRFAPLVAFSLLDLNANGVIEREEYEPFFKSAGVKRSHYEGLNDKLTSTEFVYVCEYLVTKL